ncbi:MAG: hypothetical protein REI09_09175 [Candidatus Dactylopiibacterium sp.]|nr:hypothetical protein [Candidatus Dactylopiibacterium sp.]
MKKYLLTFADARMSAAAQRLARQAGRLGVYDGILACSEVDLRADFVAQFRARLDPAARGFGYWCWKPQVILQALDGLAEGDVLQYTDSGCHLNEKGRARLHEYFSMAARSETGLLVFQAIPPSFHDGRPLLDLRERKWAKADLLAHFGFLDDQAVLESQQIGAGVIFVRKCRRSQEIIREWLGVYEMDFSLGDDTPSRIPDLPGFVEHRHDQSIFSLLCKKHGVAGISSYEYWYPRRGKFRPDWNALKAYPVHARRDRGLAGWKRVWNLLQRLGNRLRGGASKTLLSWHD